MLATNASGARAFRHGYTRDHVAALRVVLDSGDAVDGRPAVALARRRGRARPARGHRLRRRRRCWSRTPTLIRDLPAADAASTAAATCCTTCSTPSTSTWPALLVGSEGTLALFTEATLRTVPLPAGRALVLLGFASLDAALRAAAAGAADRPGGLRADRPPAADAWPAAATPTVAALVPAAAEAVLLVEYEADTPAEAARPRRDLADRLQRGDRLALLAPRGRRRRTRSTASGRLREAALPSLYGLRGAAAAGRLRRGRRRAAGGAAGVPAPRAGRAAAARDDRLVPGPRRRPGRSTCGRSSTCSSPDDVAKLWALADEVYALALELGGTISTQHGTGLARTPWVARQYGRLYPVFRELKAIFDPRHLFNPGKIVGPDPALPAWPLRGSRSRRALSGAEPRTARRPRQPRTRSSRWQPGEVAGESRRLQRLRRSAGPRRPASGCARSSGPPTTRRPRRGPRPTCCATCSSPTPTRAGCRSDEVREPWPTCASTARCARASARPTSTSPS